jgi:hypothetical protein
VWEEQGILFGQKRDEVTDGSRTLHNEVFRNLYFLLSIIGKTKRRRMQWAEHVAQKEGDSYGISVGTPERSRTLRRSTCYLEDNIKMDLKGEECDGVDCICLVQDRGQWRVLMDTLTNPRVP